MEIDNSLRPVSEKPLETPEMTPKHVTLTQTKNPLFSLIKLVASAQRQYDLNGINLPSAPKTNDVGLANLQALEDLSHQV